MFRFLQIMLPCDDMYLRSVATQRPNYKVGRYDRLPATVERELTNLLEREVGYHTRVERLKHELHLRYDWTNRAAFETIDSFRDHALNINNIKSFLRLNGFYATEAELTAIIRRLDVDADQKITYEEFIEAFRPQSSASENLGASSLSASIGVGRLYEEEKKERGGSPLRDSSYLTASQLGSSTGFRATASPNRLGAS